MNRTPTAYQVGKTTKIRMEHARRETIDLLRNAGAKVDGLRERDTALATLGDMMLCVRDDGGLSFNALTVDAQHIAETVRLLAKVCHGPSPDTKLKDGQ